MRHMKSPPSQQPQAQSGRKLPQRDWLMLHGSANGDTETRRRIHRAACTARTRAVHHSEPCSMGGRAVARETGLLCTAALAQAAVFRKYPLHESGQWILAGVAVYAAVRLWVAALLAIAAAARKRSLGCEYARQRRLRAHAIAAEHVCMRSAGHGVRHHCVVRGPAVPAAVPARAVL